MKLSLLNNNTPVVSDDAEVTDNSIALTGIEFTKKDNTTFEAAVPIRLPGIDGRKPTALQKITLTGSSEKAKGGTMRLLCKVNVPYLALDPNQPASAVSNSQFDPSRSGRDITAHVVLTLPKAAVEDLRGQRVGSAGVACAQAQVGLVRSLMGILWGTLTGRSGKTAATVAIHSVNGLTWHPTFVGPGDGNVPGVPVKEPGVVQDVEGYEGINGLDATNSGTDLSDPDSFLTRALIGLAPINENTTLGYVATKVDAPV